MDEILNSLIGTMISLGFLFVFFSPRIYLYKKIKYSNEKSERYLRFCNWNIFALQNITVKAVVVKRIRNDSGGYDNFSEKTLKDTFVPRMSSLIGYFKDKSNFIKIHFDNDVKLLDEIEEENSFIKVTITATNSFSNITRSFVRRYNHKSKIENPIND